MNATTTLRASIHGSSQTKPKPWIQLSNGSSIGINDAGRILKDVSKSTLYKWAKNGLDNKIVDQLLTIHVERRVIPSTKEWHGWSVNHLGELCCERHARRKGMTPYQLEQTLFLQNLFIHQSEVIDQIRDSLFAINGQLTNSDLLRAQNTNPQGELVHD